MLFRRHCEVGINVGTYSESDWLARIRVIPSPLMLHSGGVTVSDRAGSVFKLLILKNLGSGVGRA